MASAEVDTGRVPDVIQGGPRSQKDHHRKRRYSRKASRDLEDMSPRTSSIPPADQWRKSRPEGIRLMAQRRQQQALRRARETALLPPIRVSSLHQTGTSSTHGAKEMSSPTSNLSCPPGGSLAEDNHALQTSSSLLVPLPDRELSSPFNRKDTRSMLSVLDSPDTPRLSPIANSDYIRQKSERRKLKSVNDVVNDVTLGSKTPTVLAENAVRAPKPRFRSKANGQISMQSLPKLTPNEEQFSIRRKIEQFRKWHEEQYTEKLKKLKVDMEKEAREADSKLRAQTDSMEVDFARLLEENMKSSLKKTTEKNAKKNPVISEKTSTEGTTKTSTRCKSCATWRTWRDVNDSYAYDDVAKYIEENELMPPDRVNWINAWIGDVEKAFSANRVEELREEENLTIDLPGFPLKS